MTLDSAGLEGVSCLRGALAPRLLWLFCCGSIFQQAGRSYYLFLNYMFFNYMYVRVFHPWNRAVIRVFHPNFTVWSPGVSSWQTPPDHRLLWKKGAIQGQGRGPEGCHPTS